MNLSIGPFLFDKVEVFALARATARQMDYAWSGPAA